MTLEQLLGQIIPPDKDAIEAAWRRWDSVAKPLRSLGLFEEAVVKLAGIAGSAKVTLPRRATIVLCADNGVVAEGVTQCGCEVTALVAENMTRGLTSLCQMSRVAHADVIPVDIGIASDLSVDGLRQHKIAHGTQNIAVGPAMTRAQALDALLYGASLVCELKAQGYSILATGEMGIGNTTTSSAIVSVLLGQKPETVTGRGAGLSGAGLIRKISAIERALAVNAPDPADPLDVLAKVGGFDLAGLCGIFLGGAAYHVPIVVDGFISAAAALVAQRICPAARDYMLASHISNEPAGRMTLSALGLKPLICAEMRLGEGTGAVALFPLLDMALAVYNEMSTFDQIALEEYKPLS